MIPIAPSCRAKHAPDPWDAPAITAHGPYLAANAGHNRLAAAGYVQRRPNPADGRGVLAGITAANQMFGGRWAGDLVQGREG